MINGKNLFEQSISNKAIKKHMKTVKLLEEQGDDYTTGNYKMIPVELSK